MNNLTQIQELFAGIYNIYIIYSQKITFGDIIAGELQDVSLIDGGDYIKIPFTLNSGAHETRSRNKKILLNDHGIELFLPGNDLDQIQDLTQMDGNTFVLMFEDRENRFWFVGTPENPFRFDDNYSTSETPGKANGRKLTFECEGILPILSVNKPVNLDYSNPILYFSESSIEFQIRLPPTEIPQTVVIQLSDGRSVQKSTTDGYALYTISFDNMPEDGKVEFLSGAELLYELRIITEQGLFKIDNISGFFNLEVFNVSNQESLSLLDFTDCDTIINITASYCGVTKIILPESNNLLDVDLQSSSLSNIDLSKTPKIQRLILRPYFTNIDISALDFDNVDGLVNIILMSNYLSQSVVDKIISDILDKVSVSGKSGTLNISYTSTPSAIGLANISTLETTYGWTITHD